MNVKTFMPEANSDYAVQIDWLYFYLNAVSVFFTVLIFALIIIFAVKYRRRSEADRPHGEHESAWLELVGSVIPFILVMSMFVWGAVLYLRQSVPPKDALEIFVTGKQWMWKVQHPNGKREINDLHVPAGVPVKLTFISEDVIHSYYLPDLRVKRDVVPGRYTQLWFEAKKPGESHIFCAEYCGSEHSRMIGRLHVMAPADYEQWVSFQAPPFTGAVAGAPAEGENPLVARGKALFTQFACNTCHQPQPGLPVQLGPKLGGILGQKRSVFLDMAMTQKAEITVDDAYLLESIALSNAKIAEGFQPAMPPFKGVIPDADINALVAYIKTIPAGQ
jgi:cytochrome c oxidase subunit 2